MIAPEAASRAANRVRVPYRVVVVGTPLDLSRAHGQQWLGPIQRLNLALFVDAEDHGVLRRRQIQAHDIAHLLDKQRIGRKLEGLGAMGLEVEGLPYPMDRRRREARGVRHGAQAPVRRVPRRRLQCPANDFGDLVVADLPRRARSRLVHQPVSAMLRKSLAPLADSIGRCVHPQRDAFVLQPLRGKQNDPSPWSQSLRRSPARRKPQEFAPLALRQSDRNRGLAHRQSSRESIRRESHVFVDQDTRSGLLCNLISTNHLKELRKRGSNSRPVATVTWTLFCCGIAWRRKAQI